MRHLVLVIALLIAVSFCGTSADQWAIHAKPIFKMRGRPGEEFEIIIIIKGHWV